MNGDNLQDFIETASSVLPFRVESDFGGGYVRLRSEEAERRQAAHDIRAVEDIVIEALRNARDAHARTVFLAIAKYDAVRKIVVLDDGDGIPPSMHQRIFDSRVTSKLDSMHLDKWGVHGRGMALYSIASNCLSAHVASSNVGLGASFVFEADNATLPEKTDQSTFPAFELADNDTVRVRGPKNIVRTACEFAVDSSKNCTLYFGSIAEIAATLFAYGNSTLSPALRAFADDKTSIPVCKRLATAADPSEFARIAEQLGLSLSERTARRVMNGEIKPLAPLIDSIHIVHTNKRKGSSSPRRKCRYPDDQRGLKIDPADLSRFSDSVKTAFNGLARDYFLMPDVQPEVSVKSDCITISIPLEKL